MEAALREVRLREVAAGAREQALREAQGGQVSQAGVLDAGRLVRRAETAERRAGEAEASLVREVGMRRSLELQATQAWGLHGGEGGGSEG